MTDANYYGKVRVYPKKGIEEMRDICFRAWNNITNRMHQFKIETMASSSPWHPGFWYCEICETYIDQSDISELMQYTGLKDKNGKEIYEGDIVRVKGQYIDWENFAVTQYFGGAWGLENGEEYLRDIISPSALRYDTETGKPVYTEIEVIGNIWESPQLLEVK